jgi:ABC-2 type transport system permease protein
MGRGFLGRLDYLLGFLHDPLRALIVKDIRLFWRDPIQWTQFFIFFGLMAAYIANLGNRSMELASPAYRSWVASLNAGACALILASLTSRFVYPLISLEGFRFWILGLAPITRRQLVWQKFWLSVATTSPFTLGLTFLSCLLLDVSRIQFAVSMYTITCANFALAGLAVGLGSLYPNFEEDNPARIVSGMGGTLNFLLSVAYITLVLGSQMLILQWHALSDGGVPYFGGMLAAVLAVNSLLSGVAALVPMRMGLRNLVATEF